MAAPPLYHLINLWISLTRYLHEAADADRQQRFGTQVGDLLVRAGIYLGTIEAQPMTAAKLAAYVGIPRPTVVRRLRALERRGLVERRGRTWVTPQRLISRRHAQDFGPGKKLVRRTHEKLLKD